MCFRTGEADPITEIDQVMTAQLVSLGLILGAGPRWWVYSLCEEPPNCSIVRAHGVPVEFVEVYRISS